MIDSNGRKLTEQEQEIDRLRAERNEARERAARDRLWRNAAVVWMQHAIRALRGQAAVSPEFPGDGEIIIALAADRPPQPEPGAPERGA